MCYCDSTEKTIVHDLKRGSIPEEALVNSCCWKEICRIRGRNFSAIDPEKWREICTERGYLLRRQNPRGF
jgi:hypothetical protein